EVAVPGEVEPRIADGTSNTVEFGRRPPVTRGVLREVDEAVQHQSVTGRSFNTEAYDHIVENGFLDAARNPLSTLSVDVHTASYSNVRRFLLQEGRLPPPDAVRIAELDNYFPYDYRPPQGRDPVAFTLDIAQ